MQFTKGKVVTVTSVKGGVGKTTFLLALAATYKRQNKKVLVIDMDLFSGDIRFAHLTFSPLLYPSLPVWL